MPFGFHGLDLVVILAIALLIFGPKKLPEMGAAIGKSIKEFKKGMNELTNHKDETEAAPKSLSLETIERESKTVKSPLLEAEEAVTTTTTHETSGTEARVD